MAPGRAEEPEDAEPPAAAAMPGVDVGPGDGASASAGPRGRRAAGHDRARDRHHQGSAHPRHAGPVRRPLLRARADARRTALRPRPAGDARRPLGREGGRVEGPRAGGPRHRLARHRGGAAADGSAGGAPPRPGGSARPTARAWTGSPSRSATNPSTPSRSRSACGSAGGRFLFPPDIEERLDDRERRILARMERLRRPGPRRPRDA